MNVDAAGEEDQAVTERWRAIDEQAGAGRRFACAKQVGLW